MSTSYNQWIQAGYNPNQAALAAQLGDSGVSRPITAPPPTSANPAAFTPSGQQRQPQPVGSPVTAPGPGPLSGKGDDLPGPPPAAPPALGSYGLEGFDAGKLSSGHDSPKYQIGRTISRFDPSQGITPEVIAALNELGLGTFEALDGDKVRVSGNVDPRFEGATTIDLIRAYSGEGADPNWQYGAIGPDGAGGGAPGGGGAPMAGGGAAPAFGTPGIDPLLSGDPLRRIQEAIQAINGQGQVNMNALLSQLQPGA